jgi:hypothetical protein
MAGNTNPIAVSAAMPLRHMVMMLPPILARTLRRPHFKSQLLNGAKLTGLPTCPATSGTGGSVRHLLLVALLVTGCARNPGISREEAEAILRQNGYSQPELSSSSALGWSGYATLQGRIRRKVTVGKHGIVEVEPQR